MPLGKKTPKKEGYFTVFWKKNQDNKNVPYTNEDLGTELIIVVIDKDKVGLFIIPKEVAIHKKILSTTNCGNLQSSITQNKRFNTRNLYKHRTSIPRLREKHVATAGNSTGRRSELQTIYEIAKKFWTILQIQYG